MRSLFFALFIVFAMVSTQAQRQWTLRNPYPARDSAGLNGSTYGGGLFVAVGEYNTLLTSPDAMTWTSQLPERLEGGGSWMDVAYGHGRFVSIGFADGQSSTIISTNGIDWAVPTLGPDFGANRIIFASNLFICFGRGRDGESLKIATSHDGLLWTTRWSGVDGWTPRQKFDAPRTASVAIGNGRIVAAWLERRVLTFLISSNGMDWSEVSLDGLHLLAPGVAYGNGRFLTVAGSDMGVPVLLHSSDGILWEEVEFPSDGPSISSIFGLLLETIDLF